MYSEPGEGEWPEGIKELPNQISTSEELAVVGRQAEEQSELPEEIPLDGSIHKEDAFKKKTEEYQNYGEVIPEKITQPT